MSRKERKDVDYFPFIVKNGRTLHVLESKYGCKGTGFFTNVLRLLAQTPDHHIQVSEDPEYFFATTHCDEKSGYEMLDIMAKRGKIDKVLWDKKKVIASKDFLDNIKDAYRSRKNNPLTMENIYSHYFVNPAQETNNTAQESPQSCAGSTQSRVEEKRVEESIYKEVKFFDLETITKELKNSKWLETVCMKLKITSIKKLQRYLVDWLGEQSLIENDPDSGGLDRPIERIKSHFTKAAKKDKQKIIDYQIGVQSIARRTVKKEQDNTPAVKSESEKNEILINIALKYFDEWCKDQTITRRLTYYTYDALRDIGIVMHNDEEFDKYAIKAQEHVLIDFRRLEERGNKYSVPKELNGSIDTKDKSAVFRAQPNFDRLVFNKTKELALFHYIEGLREQGLHLKQFICEKK